MIASHTFRFRPPALTPSAELWWVLARAFGPAGDRPQSAEAPVPLDPAVVADLARRLGLAPRLGLRAGLGRELGPKGAVVGGELARSSSLAAASQMRAMEAARTVAELAAGLGTRCCFLKGVALDALGALASGSRPLADVDVLVASADAPALARCLAAAGFVAGGGEYPHQLAPLVHPLLGAVELHRHLPGVRVPGCRSFATLADLTGAGLVTNSPGDALPAGALLPVPAALVAHLLAHALAQHGFRPTSYPGLRLIGDLIDLGLASDDGELLLTAALPLLAGVPAAEARAAVTLCRTLASGRTREALASDDEPARLLRHFVAGGLDEAYRERLKLEELRYPLAEGGRVRARLAVTRQAIFLSREQVDALYGRPRHQWGYLARRLARPLDVVWRAARAALRSRQAGSSVA